MSANVTVQIDDGPTYTFVSETFELDARTEMEEIPCTHKPDCGWVHRQETGRKFIRLDAETKEYRVSG